MHGEQQSTSQISITIEGPRTTAIKHTIKHTTVLLYVLLQMCEQHKDDSVRILEHWL